MSFQKSDVMGPPTPQSKRKFSESDFELDSSLKSKRNRVGRPSTDEIITLKIKELSESLMKIIASKDLLINKLSERVNKLEENEKARIQSRDVLDTPENIVERVKIVESSLVRINNLEQNVKTINNSSDYLIKEQRLASQFWANLDKQKKFELAVAIKKDTN